MDEEKKEKFAGRMIGVLNDASLALMVSLGHRTGLFDTMETLAPSTSEAIAESAGLNERYVREWLGAMATAKVVEYDAKARTYVLPKEHAASLTRSSGAANLAPWLRFVPFVARVEDQVVDCFRRGGGVPYAEYVGFSEAMHEASAPMFEAVLMGEVLPMTPDISRKLQSGIDVLEVGCGTGHALMLMAKQFPESRFTGYDLLESNIAQGQERAAAGGIGNATFELKDVVTMTHEGSFDLVTAFDTVHDQAQPDVLLSGITRALKPGGTFLMSDVKASTHLENNLDHPIGTFGYAVSCMHCMTVSLARDGMGLGAMWGEEKAKEMIEAAGMELTEVRQAEGDPLNNFYIARRP